MTTKTRRVLLNEKKYVGEIPAPEYANSVQPHEECLYWYLEQEPESMTVADLALASGMSPKHVRVALRGLLDSGWCQLVTAPNHRGFRYAVSDSYIQHRAGAAR